MQSLINAVDMPVRQALTVEFVERREHLGNAIALNSALFNPLCIPQAREEKDDTGRQRTKFRLETAGVKGALPAGNFASIGFRVGVACKRVQ